MKSEWARRPFPVEVAGPHVEVIDARSKLHGRVGVVEFFVADNVYVTFDGLRWAPTRMFFPEQLRTVPAPERSVRRNATATFVRGLRLSLAKMRL
jgi:hypothetical protein